MRGVMSSMPTRGITRLSGARIGSVMAWRKPVMGLGAGKGNQESRALAMMAKVSTWTR